MDKKLLWLIFCVTRGGPVRAEIVYRLKERPYNANQLARELNLDYKTIKYHLKILLQHNAVAKTKDIYSAMYTLSDEMESSYADFFEIYKRQKKVSAPYSEEVDKNLRTHAAH